MPSFPFQRILLGSALYSLNIWPSPKYFLHFFCLSAVTVLVLSKQIQGILRYISSLSWRMAQFVCQPFECCSSWQIDSCCLPVSLCFAKSLECELLETGLNCFLKLPQISCFASLGYFLSFSVKPRFSADKMVHKFEIGFDLPENNGVWPFLEVVIN